MTLDLGSGARVLCICNGHPDSKPGSVTPMIGLRVSQDFAATILEREREKEKEKESEEERGGSGDVRQGSGVGCGIVAELRLLFGPCCLSSQGNQQNSALKHTVRF